MSIHAYRNIDGKTLDTSYTTSGGQPYTLRCSDALKVDMNFIGQEKSASNAQGWERSSNYYFEKLMENHPEMFSAKNAMRVQNKQAPVVDQKMIDQNPAWAAYRGETLIHHHIGGDGEAVAVPQSVHKGFGEIHNAEKAAGITQSCRAFSDKCQVYVSQNPEARGQSAADLRSALGESRENTVTVDSSESRADAVRSVLSENSADHTDSSDRAQSVRDALSESSAASAAPSQSHTESSDSPSGESNGQSR